MQLFLYHLIIAPLEQMMRFILETAYAVTGAWGTSLLLLSLAVNIVLIPLYHMAEGWQEQERRLQAKMAPKLAEIKAVYHGRERYMYSRALYRLHGYSPIMGLRTGCGLLIQIPFFFAAYHLLHAAPELAGKSFLVIHDLSLSDALVTLMGHSINALPFLMTGINLASATVYTSRLSRGEKIQIYGLAALFLVLLYSSSAALLVYWTCNNIFSLIKNCIYSRYIYAKASGSAAETTVAPRLPLRFPIFPCARWGDLFFALGAAAAYIVIKILPNADYDVYIIGLAVVLAACAVVLRFQVLRKDAPQLPPQLPPHLAALLPQLMPFLCLFAFTVFMAICTMTSFKRLVLPSAWWYHRLFAAAVALIVLWVVGQKHCCLRLARLAHFCATRLTHASFPLFFSGITLTTVLLFVVSPAALYASDPDFFHEPLAALWGAIGFYSFVSLLLGVVIFRIMPPALHSLLAVCAAWVSLCALLYLFAVPADYGTMDGFLLQNPALLRTRLAIFVDIAVLLAAAGVLYAVLRWYRAAALTLALRGLSGIFLLVAVIQLALVPPFEPAPNALPEYAKELFSFSRQGQNVVVLMLDMFTGGHIEELFKEDPALRDTFDGFTWYPDTVSPGATTILSIAGIMGGEQYTPTAMNKRKAPLEETMHTAFATIPNLLAPRGFHVALADVELLRPDIFEKYCPSAAKTLIVGKSLSTAFTEYWRAKKGLPSIMPKSMAPFLTTFGFFRASPWVFRQAIYNDGSWLNTQNFLHNHSEGPLAMLDSMPEISNTDSSSSTFKYIASQLVHYPWQIDPVTCMPIDTQEKTLLPSGIIAEHLDTERCALRAISRWLAWLKDNDVYDNTHIILLSDHSGGDSAQMDKRFDFLRKKNIPWKPHALLLTKPPKVRGPLAVDSHLMSSTDVLALVCRENGPCPDLAYVDPFAVTSSPRVRTHDAGLSSIRRHEADRFNVDHYTVNGTMFQPENWKAIKNK